jgi:hypothetical protein
MAMLEDVVDLVESMREVEAALALPPDADPSLRSLTWPGMPVVAGAPDVIAVLDALEALGADEGAVVCADVPDLPVLLLGKLHSALTDAQVAVCPADGGGLVALATRLPASGWLRDLGPRLDEPTELARIKTAAPTRTLVVGPGWHRVRTTQDLGALDPGLEGWEATRALLGR